MDSYANLDMTFAQAMLKIQGTMLNPLVSQDKKRKALCGAVDALSDDVFNSHIMHIIEIINKKKKECQKYDNTEAQVDAILEWLPRMKKHRVAIAIAVKERRKQYGLKL